MNRIDEKTIQHFYAAAVEGGGFLNDVDVTLDDYGEDPPFGEEGHRGFRYELQVVHPERTHIGHKQSPEVQRFALEEDARLAFETYCGVLDNSVDPKMRKLLSAGTPTTKR